MRTIILGALVAIGIGLTGSSGATAAAPAPGGILAKLMKTQVQQAQYYYYRRRYYCRRVRVCDYYGRCYYERRCDY